MKIQKSLFVILCMLSFNGSTKSKRKAVQEIWQTETIENSTNCDMIVKANGAYQSNYESSQLLCQPEELSRFLTSGGRIIEENYQFSKKLKTSHGFSCGDSETAALIAENVPINYDTSNNIIPNAQKPYFNACLSNSNNFPDILEFDHQKNNNGFCSRVEMQPCNANNDFACKSIGLMDESCAYINGRNPNSSNLKQGNLTTNQINQLSSNICEHNSTIANSNNFMPNSDPRIHNDHNNPNSNWKNCLFEASTQNYCNFYGRNHHSTNNNLPPPTFSGEKGLEQYSYKNYEKNCVYWTKDCDYSFTAADEKAIDCLLTKRGSGDLCHNKLSSKNIIQQEFSSETTFQEDCYVHTNRDLYPYIPEINVTQYNESNSNHYDLESATKSTNNMQNNVPEFNAAKFKENPKDSCLYNTDESPVMNHHDTILSSLQNSKNRNSIKNEINQSILTNGDVKQSLTLLCSILSNPNSNLNSEKCHKNGKEYARSLPEHYHMALEKCLVSLPQETFMNQYEFVDTENVNEETINYKGDFAIYIGLVENDLHFSFIYIIKCINDLCFLTKSRSLRHDCMRTMAINKFYTILSKTYDRDLSDIKKDSSVGLLYNEFMNYQSWLFKVFTIDSHENNKYALYELKTYLKISENFRTEESNVLEFYAKIFYTKNYRIIRNILPCFNLIDKIKIKNVDEYQTVKIIRCIQLIICKFEAFRYKYYNKNVIEEVNIQNLYKYPEFNETLLIMNILLKKILFYYEILEESEIILEIYNIIYFIRAKCNEIFRNSEFFNYIAYTDPFKSNILIKKTDKLNNVINLEFTKSFKSTELYKIISRLISKKNKKLTKTSKILTG
ncbi:hypothetical protein H312_00530 [Anncaliia algerae PRA339]|uniref:Uncharacterized protein n=1 Tax=Anncaliia algerae PRA339 TaxID=1288291 RepID=A0A059F481_9MICR|nr:hypothetical protein H312_00530 [Anncaliia algerae PRA339]